jgi:hypothetical protein
MGGRSIYRTLAPKRTPFQTGIECERFLEGESATYILCECEAIAYLRFRHLGHFFMEPGDYYDAAINKVLHFTRGVGLTKG